jgi:hypothetical protein
MKNHKKHPNKRKKNTMMKMLHKSHRLIAPSINLALLKINHLGILSNWPRGKRLPKLLLHLLFSAPKIPCRRLARSPLFFARIVVI